MGDGGEFDLVVVGGGIGGSALALVMAGAGHSCLVLERTTSFPDRTRGEWLAPWGVLEARRLGIEDVLRSARGHVLRRHVTYEPETSREDAEARELDLSIMAPDVEGPMTQRHPDACQALFDAASAAGATCLRAVEHVVVDAGPDTSTVRFRHDGTEREVRCRLVVGADGRQSTVRRQLGIALRTDEPHHLFSGMLVDDADGFPEDLEVVGTTDEVHYLAFPQGGGRIRLYLGFAFDDRHRYTGDDGARRFLDAFDVPSLPFAEAIVGSTPVSPHAVYANEDAWVDTPVAPGVVLVGDAAGWNDPIIGQGLSITLRDVRVVTEILRSSTTWDVDTLREYTDERNVRMGRLGFAGRVASTYNNEFGPEAVARRERAKARMAENGLLSMAFAVVLIGPEHIPPGLFSQELWDELFVG
jgi:menaquinone-9 beta-reductase